MVDKRVNHAIMGTQAEKELPHMQPTLEQAFTIDLEQLISQYITQGMAPGRVEEIMQQAVEGLFESLSEEDAE